MTPSQPPPLWLVDEVLGQWSYDIGKQYHGYTPPFRNSRTPRPMASVDICQVCLEHRHSYVRRNAALACYYIHKNFGQQVSNVGRSKDVWVD